MIQIDLSGQVAVVTGGSSGIGLATAALFLRAGASVAICGRDAARLAHAERDLRERFPHVPRAALLTARCDVLDARAVAAFADQVKTHFGRTDMLVNNAGQGRVSTFADTTDDAWRAELDLKYFSIIHPVRAFLPMLRAAALQGGKRENNGHGEHNEHDERNERSQHDKYSERNGHNEHSGNDRPNAAIVCVNSLLALQPEPHMVATSSARAGALSLVKSLAGELAPEGIRVNSILIGIVESGQWRRRYAAYAQAARASGLPVQNVQCWQDWMRALAREKRIPLGRLGRPDEAARALFYLATSLSSYTTGSHIDVSGGVARHV